MVTTGTLAQAEAAALARLAAARARLDGDSGLAAVAPGVFIGSVAAARNLPGLKAAGITHILNASPAVPCFFAGGADGGGGEGDDRRAATTGPRASPPPPPPPSPPCPFTYARVPVYDDPDEDLVSHLPPALAFIDGCLAAGGSVLIHCYAGRSRSAALAAAHLVAAAPPHAPVSLAAALASVAAARPGAAPNSGFIAQLAAWAAGGREKVGGGGGGAAAGPLVQGGEEAAALLAPHPHDRHHPLRCRPHPPHRLAAAAAAWCGSLDGAGPNAAGVVAPPPAAGAPPAPLRPTSPWSLDGGGGGGGGGGGAPSEAGSTPAGVTWSWLAGRGGRGGSGRAREPSPGLFGSSVEDGGGAGGGGGPHQPVRPAPHLRAHRRHLWAGGGGPSPSPPPMSEDGGGGDDDGAVAEGELR